VTSRGRKPKPVELRLVQGNPGKRPVPKRAPKPKGSLSAPPADMSPAAKAEWRYVLANQPAGLLTKVDRAILRIYCDEMALYKEAKAGIKETGLLVSTPNGAVQTSPLVTIMRQAEEKVLRTASEMGMTPSARVRLALPDDDDDNDPWASHGKRS
jgi:P27 family predicted phage terminase small subunit